MPGVLSVIKSKFLTQGKSANALGRRFGILSTIKNCFVPSGKKDRLIKYGLFKGLRMNLDLRCQMQVFLGLWERETYSYLRDFTRRARSCIDVGAGEGEYSLFFLSRTNIESVIAIDPSESFPKDFCANLALNGFNGDPRLTMIKKYVSDHEDHDHCTLDSFADIEGPCVIKIDVDGPEATILHGARKLLERRDVSWVIETHSVELEKECIQEFTSKGLKTVIICNTWWRLFIPEKRSIQHNRWLAAYHE